jgi:nucleotide-binding universal stress UspA family protein
MLRPAENGVLRSRNQHPFQRIIVPLDRSTSSTDILAPAAALARATGAHLFLITVVQPTPIVTPEAAGPYSLPTVLVDDAATKSLVDEARGELDAVVKRLRAEGVQDVDATVVTDQRPAAAIADFARAKNADLIAMATHGRGASRVFLGSVADGVMRATRLPVLLEHPLSVHNRSAVVGPPAGG